MSKLLARIEKQLIESGLFPDLEGEAAPVWKTGANVRFDALSVQPFPGERLLFVKQQAEPIIGMQSILLNGVPTLCFGTLTKLWLWDETSGLQDVTRLAGDYNGSAGSSNSARTHWSIVPWGAWIAATNGVDPPQLYKAGNFADNAPADPNVFGTAKFYARWRNYIFALQLDVTDWDIAWADEDDIEDWVSTSTNAARQLPVRDLSSEITCVLESLNGPVFWSHDSMHLVEWVRPPFYFGVRKLRANVGANSSRAVVSADGKWFGWGPRGIWVTDGNTEEFIANSRVIDYVEANYDNNRPDLVNVHHARRTNHIIFSFKSKDGSDVDSAIAFNLKNSAWTILNYGRTVAVDAGVFKTAISGDALGNVFTAVLGEAPAIDATVGILQLANEIYSVQAGFGECGFGELGYGGIDDGS